MSIITLALGTLVVVLVGLQLTGVALSLWRYLVPGRIAAASTGPGQPAQPFITLLRPVCGLDPFDEETLGSSFTLDYPAYEVIFCAARDSDPAVGLVRRLIAAHPQVPAQLLIGEDMISTNPKLNNLAKGWAVARGEWIAMTDSNLMLPRDYFQRLLAAWTPGTGLVTSPPAGLRPGNLWGAVECAFLNSFQARWQLASDALGNGFAQGKTLFWRRDVLDGAGGLAALGRNLAEDVASTKVVRDQGLHVRLTRTPFAQPIGSREARAVWDRQLRWSRVRRDGFPGLFALEILVGPVVPMLALAVVAPLWLLPALVLWYGPEVILARVAGWPAGPRDLLAMVLRDLALPALWAATWARRGFEWRGTAMAGELARPGVK